MKLLIAIPCMDFMHVEFVKSLNALVVRLKNDGIDFDVHFEAGTLVYMARDRIVCKAINEKYTDVLWLDSDMVFTDSLLEDLQFCGKNFVTGIAHSRRRPFGSCLFKNIDLKHLERYKGDDYPKEPFEIQGCGLACALTSVKLLTSVQIKFKTCFTPIIGYGEDIAFCKRALEQGFHIWADPSVRVGHIGHITIYPDDMNRFADEIEVAK